MAAKTNRFFNDEADRELRRIRMEKMDAASGKAPKKALPEDAGNQAMEQASFLLLVIALAVFVAVGVYFLAS